jgi:hypothetical protein
MYIEVEFGTGDVTGECNRETIALGEIKIENQPFCEITLETGDVFVAG